jgi:signal transduction histidine kinase
MVKTAVEKMGGHVGVKSQSGQGSRFWIDLPNAGA